jgi:hypothetical protein
MEVKTEAPDIQNILREKAVEKFKEVVNSKRSRQEMKQFLTERANIFLSKSTPTSLPRASRRIAARALAKRIVKRALAGEEILG